METIRPELATALRSKVAMKYGIVLLRAWKEGGEEARSLLQSEVQELGVSAAHAEHLCYFRNLRLLLSKLHEQKNIKGMDAFLLSVYDPFLWRSLKCANAVVRAQSAALFLDAFPIQSPQEGQIRTEQRLQQQFEIMQDLLKDEDHRVRALAARNVCRVLRDYWEAFPINTIRGLLVTVCSKLAKDISCIHVRVAGLLTL